jgi:nitroimidazol reductase NimA-like FMN-containing flavoprotein (pyridoxamine 5'-phosphate oxidase superfamily)
MTAYLAHHDVCVLSTAGSQGAWAMPVRYRPLPGTFGNHGLEVECLVPRWTDVAYHLEQDPRVVLIVQGCHASSLRWLQVQGTAQPVAAPGWAELLPGQTSTTPPDDLYLVIRVAPKRIDLMDESRGWGARETLEV